MMVLQTERGQDPQFLRPSLGQLREMRILRDALAQKTEMAR